MPSIAAMPLGSGPPPAASTLVGDRVASPRGITTSGSSFSVGDAVVGLSVGILVMGVEDGILVGEHVEGLVVAGLSDVGATEGAAVIGDEDVGAGEGAAETG
mmetsp:Transcript_4396/g.8001  ORF Transcript_4396/g.8001 Transcript_4396/m.8001 type:complete len:102 (+) Transcript_4396:806-1111(+)